MCRFLDGQAIAQRVPDRTQPAIGLVRKILRPAVRLLDVFEDSFVFSRVVSNVLYPVKLT